MSSVPPRPNLPKIKEKLATFKDKYRGSVKDVFSLQHILRNSLTLLQSLGQIMDRNATELVKLNETTSSQHDKNSHIEDTPLIQTCHSLVECFNVHSSWAKEYGSSLYLDVETIQKRLQKVTSTHYDDIETFDKKFKQIEENYNTSTRHLGTFQKQLDKFLKRLDTADGAEKVVAHYSKIQNLSKLQMIGTPFTNKSRANLQKYKEYATQKESFLGVIQQLKIGIARLKADLLREDEWLERYMVHVEKRYSEMVEELHQTMYQVNIEIDNLTSRAKEEQAFLFPIGDSRSILYNASSNNLSFRKNENQGPKKQPAAGVNFLQNLQNVQMVVSQDQRMEESLLLPRCVQPNTSWGLNNQSQLQGVQKKMLAISEQKYSQQYSRDSITIRKQLEGTLCVKVINVPRSTKSQENDHMDLQKLMQSSQELLVVNMVDNLASQPELTAKSVFSKQCLVLSRDRNGQYIQIPATESNIKSLSRLFNKFDAGKTTQENQMTFGKDKFGPLKSVDNSEIMPFDSSNLLSYGPDPNLFEPKPEKTETGTYIPIVNPLKDSAIVNMKARIQRPNNESQPYTRAGRKAQEMLMEIRNYCEQQEGSQVSKVPLVIDRDTLHTPIKETKSVNYPQLTNKKPIKEESAADEVLRSQRFSQESLVLYNQIPQVVESKQPQVPLVLQTVNVEGSAVSKHKTALTTECPSTIKNDVSVTPKYQQKSENTKKSQDSEKSQPQYRNRWFSNSLYSCSENTSKNGTQNKSSDQETFEKKIKSESVQSIQSARAPLQVSEFEPELQLTEEQLKNESLARAYQDYKKKYKAYMDMLKPKKRKY